MAADIILTWKNDLVVSAKGHKGFVSIKNPPREYIEAIAEYCFGISNPYVKGKTAPPNNLQAIRTITLDFFQNGGARSLTPLYTGNLYDSIAARIFSEGRPIGGYITHKKVATRKQYWGGPYPSPKAKDVGGGNAGGWGVDYLEGGYGTNNRGIHGAYKDLYQGDSDYAIPKLYGVMIYCGIPYGKYLEDGLSAKRAGNHRYWFTKLSQEFYKKLTYGLVRQINSSGIKCAVGKGYMTNMMDINRKIKGM